WVWLLLTAAGNGVLLVWMRLNTDTTQPAAVLSGRLAIRLSRALVRTANTDNITTTARRMSWNATRKLPRRTPTTGRRDTWNPSFCAIYITLAGLERVRAVGLLS